jgi:cytochrome oxidase assembly protein ShyY1
MTIALTLYVLIWPVVVAGVLVLIARGFVRELRQAKREGRTII